MMTKETDTYRIGECDFYCGIALADNPYDKEVHPIRHSDWQFGWRDAFLEFVIEMEENKERGEDDEEKVWLAY